MNTGQPNLTRRAFLVRGGQAALGAFAAGTLFSCAARNASPQVALPRRVLGANDRINIAAIGIRSRGFELSQGFAKLDNVFIKTLVDPDENLFADRVKKIGEIQGAAPGVETDLRRALEDPGIDAVLIATPDHWHALATVWACQAGKHVYVEKPVTHKIWEGRKMIEASRHHGTLVSTGFHNRSIGGVRRAMKFLHDGGIGEIYMAKGLCYKPRDGIGRVADGPVPAGVNYDLWLGPTPARPFNENRFHYNWHWFWEYGGGDIGNQGPHQFDIARWGLDKHEHPVKVQSMGGYYQWNSDQETPNTQVAIYEYADGKILQFEVRGLYTNDEHGLLIGNLFYGTKGWMHLGVDTKWATYFGRKNEPGPSSDTVEEDTDPLNLAGAGGGNHFENFISALRAGRRDLLTCEIEEGHKSTVLPHLANIAYRRGRTLEFDGERERFTNDDQANALLRRKYRAPFVLPERVQDYPTMKYVHNQAEDSRTSARPIVNVARHRASRRAPRTARALILSLSLAASFLAAGCDDDTRVVVLKLAHGLDNEHPVHRAMLRLAEEVARRSGGTMRVDVYPSEQLGSERECIELVQLGILAMTKTSSAPMESFVPAMKVFGLPYLFRDSDHMWRVLDGPIGRELLAAGTNKGLRGLCFYDSGARSFYTVNKPIRAPADLAGLKIRVQKSPMAMRNIQALGASPTPIDWGELYTALQQGMVDGAENNPPSFCLSRHFETCRYYTLDEHVRQPDVVVINPGVWASLTLEQQAILQAAADESVKFQRELWAKSSADSLARVEAAGIEIIRPDQQPFRDAVRPLWAEFAGTPIGDLAERIRAVQSE